MDGLSSPQSPDAGLSNRMMESLTMAPRKPLGHIRLTSFLHEISEWTKAEFLMCSSRVFGYKFHKPTRVVTLYTTDGVDEFQPGQDACVVFPEKDWTLFYKRVWKDLNDGGEEPLYVGEWDGVTPNVRYRVVGDHTQKKPNDSVYIFCCKDKTKLNNTRMGPILPKEHQDLYEMQFLFKWCDLDLLSSVFSIINKMFKCCGISFGSILDPPDDDAPLHTLTDACGPSGLHNDWVSAKTARRRIDLEPCFENDWAPGNIISPEPSDLQNDSGLAIKRSLDWDLEIECDCSCTKPSPSDKKHGCHNLTYLINPDSPNDEFCTSPGNNIIDKGWESPPETVKSLGIHNDREPHDSSTIDRTLPHSNRGFDATDGCFSDVGFKIIKAATVVLLQHLINDKQKDECEGCAINHPSQLQHSCLFDPPNYYFDTHFDELSGKLFKPSFHTIITTLLERCGLKSRPHRIQGTVGTILHELKDEPFIAAKVEEIRARLLDKPCKEIVYDVVDLWENLPNANGQ
ncbi:hypothetical protein PO909_010932 [Leuciscus waleckii]